MNEDENMFPSAPDVNDAFSQSKDSAPEDTKQSEEEPDEKTYDEPELNLNPPNLAPGGDMGGIALLSGIQGQTYGKRDTEHTAEAEQTSEKTMEEKSQNSNDILNRASVMLNEDWQKANDPEVDPTEGYEP